MSRRDSDRQNEPNEKKRKINSVCTRGINDSIADMSGMPFVEQNVTLSASNEIHGDLDIEKPPKVCDDAGTFTTIEKEQRSTEESDHQNSTLLSNNNHIDNLPVELLIYIFDYLSLEDLFAIRKTSKRWNQISGYCFHRNYSAILTVYKGNEEKAIRTLKGYRSGVKLNDFSQFVQRIHIYELDEFHHFLNKNPGFQQLEHIELRKMDLTGIKVDCVKAILHKVKCLRMIWCKTDEHFVNHIVALMPNLKHLDLRVSEVGEKWLYSKYPSLERLSFVTGDTVAISTFLENNPNIKHFGISSRGSCGNLQSMRTAKVILDDLAIYISDNGACSLKSLCLLLNELHDIGIYKHLKLYNHHSTPRMSNDDLVSLKGLTKIYIGAIPHIEDGENCIKYVQSLQEFRVWSTSDITDIEAVATNLQNLERIHVTYANFEHIALFIKKSTKLREIIVGSFDNAEFLRDGFEPDEDYPTLEIKPSDEKPKFIDLFWLNQQRAKLSNAEKISLFVDEEMYLTTKWKMKATDFKLISLKRRESSEMLKVITNVDFGLLAELSSN